MIKKIFGGGLFTLGSIFCMVGGCALDSELLTFSLQMIAAGVIIGFLGYHMMGVKKW